MKNISANVIDLSSRRKIFPDFNVFNHIDNPTTDPIMQRDIIAATMRNTKDLSSTEKLVLLEIATETVCRGFYYTFITQKEIAEHLGCGLRSVEGAIKKLIEEDWIAVKRSEKYTRRNVIDFNVERVMPFTKNPEKYNKPQKLRVKLDKKSDTRKNCGTEENLTNSSLQEELICGTSRTTNREVKRKRSCSSLGKTWNNSCAYNFSQVDVRIPRKEFVKFKIILDKFNLDDEELHEFVWWCVENWDYCWRRFDSKDMPKIPNHNWFIACRNKFYEIWWENLKDIKPDDERVVELKKYVKIDSKRKWRHFDGFDRD